MRVVDTVMGIPMSVDMPDEADIPGHNAAKAAFDSLRTADRTFSTYREDSEVAAVNSGTVKPGDYSDDLREVLAIATHAEQISGNAFRARRLGGALDLNGVVKGWAVQRAADILVAHGVESFCFNVGGDIIVHGRPPGHCSWNVAIRSPWTPEEQLAVLALAGNGAVATSGNYERTAHIVDGRTGSVPTGLVSVTVLAPDLTTADVLATSVFILGADGVPWALDHGADAVLAVRNDGTLIGAGVIPFAVPD